MQKYLKNLMNIAIATALGACGGGDVSKYSQSDINNAEAISREQLNAVFNEYFDNLEGSETPTIPRSPEEFALLPQVSASSDTQFADANVVVTLDGSVEVSQAVNDDGASRIVATQWRQLAGPSVELLAPERVNNLFISPDVAEPQQLIFILAAQDSAGRVNAANVSVVVNPINALLRVTGGVVSEADQVANFIVKLREPQGEALTVRYTTKAETAEEGIDYEASSGELTFAPGETEKTVSVNLFADEDEEDFETFTLQVTALDGVNTSTNVGAVVIRGDNPELGTSPTPLPTEEPTSEPTEEPNDDPVDEPAEPTPTPVSEPTAEPTQEPEPTVPPTTVPSPTPSPQPPASDNRFAPVWQQSEPSFTLEAHRINIGDSDHAYNIERFNGTYEVIEEGKIIAVDSMDIDNDNDPDIIITRRRSLEILYNNGSAGFSSTPIEPTTSIETNRFSLFADIDNDGDLDIVSGGSATSISWYENLGQRQWTENPIDSSFGRVALSDIDNDEDIDILLFNRFNGSINWLENQGENSFSEKPLASELPLGLQNVTMLDFNYDGTEDIVLFGDAGVHLLTSNSELVFERTEISPTSCNQLEIMQRDFVKLLCYSQRNGFFQIEDLGEETIIEDSLNIAFNGSVERFKLIDWDADQDLDIIIAAKKRGARGSDSHEYLQVFENDDSNRFSYLTTLTEAHPAFDFTTNDFDSDGQLDLAHAWNNNIVSLSYRVTAENVDTQILQMDMEIVGNLQPADINGDGNLDLLALVESQFTDYVSDGIYPLHALLWFESSEEAPARNHIIGFIDDINDFANNNNGSISTPIDFDNDGDYDVVSAWENRIDFYENNGSLTLQHVEHFLSDENFSSISAITAIDYDADGITELAITHDENQLSLLDNILLVEQEDEGEAQVLNFTIETITLQQQLPPRTRLIAQDLNADGHIDLVTGPASWLINNGNGFTNEQFVANTGFDNLPQEPVGEEAPIDEDASEAGTSSDITAPQNTHAGNFQLADVNFDTYPDIVYIAPESQQINALLNNGEGGFAAPSVALNSFANTPFSLAYLHSGNTQSLVSVQPQAEGQFVEVSRGILNGNPASGVQTSRFWDNGEFKAFNSAKLVTAFNFNGDNRDDLLLNFNGELAWLDMQPRRDNIIFDGETALGTFTASDQDSENLRYSISGGADQALFTVDANTGNLSLVSPLNSNNPIDANGDNTYEVELNASDGEFQVKRTFTFTVVSES